jgi:hypothetical protein
MTEPAPDPTGPELDRVIIDASRAYIAAQRTRPRDQAAIDDAKAELDRLIAIRDAGV